MIKHVNVKASGNLEGIGYRFQILQKAVELGLNGFIKQEKDKSFTIEVEGEEQELKIFMNFAKKGVEKAQVKEFEYSTGEIQNYHGFTFGDYSVSDHYKK